MLSLALNRRIFVVIALSLGLIYMVRAIPVRAETIQIEGGNGLVISGEFTGTVAETPVTPTPGEGTFTTPAAPGPRVDQLVSVTEEIFRTLASPVVDETGPSGEGTFATPAEPNTPPPSNNGGGGGGGGGSGSRRLVATVATSTPVIVGACQPYLLKFIRFGAVNDPNEVRKLQVFLRDFQGLDVPVDGFYDESTFEAVKIFQLRYAKDILKPWGVDYATGYVYITTTLAINNLYCERDPANNLDLRSQLPVPPPASIEGLPATSTPSTTPIFLEIGAATSTGRLMLAALGLFNFFKQIPDWWWILVLLCIIIYLTFELIRERRRNRHKGNDEDQELTS